jgi:hypothetical protein
VGRALFALFLAQVGLLLISGPAAAQVTKVDTQVALVSTVNPSVFGQSVMFIATAVPADPLAGTPTGTFQFTVDGLNLGDSIVLNEGQAAVSTLSLSVGTHGVSATYSGDPAFNGSTGGLPGGQIVTKANSRVLLSTSVNPSVFGQQVTFTAVIRPIAPGSGSPQGGTVQFKVDGAGIGASVPVSGGQATTWTTTLAVGSHTVSAVFSGDASFNGSTGTMASAQVVSKAGTTTSVTSSVNPSVFGQSVTFTATVGATAPGSGTPSGSVQFNVDGSTLGGPLVLSAGTASISTSALAVGTHAVTVSYGASASFNGSTGALAGGQSITKADSVTALTSSENPSKRNQSVTFTATVNPDPPGSGSPTGTVAFIIDGGTPVTVALANRQASLSTSALSAGDHTIMAVYSGDPGFNASSSVFTQTVHRLDTTTSLTSSANPARPHQNVVFTATVSAVDAPAGTPGGSVQFLIDGAEVGSSALSGGQATFSTADLSAGQHTVTAAYLGDDTFRGSGDALLETVQKVGTGTEVASSTDPSVFHHQVTFTATVTADDPDAGTPGGSVQFSIDGVDQGSSALSGGQATLSLASLPVGVHTVRAEYQGDDTFSGSADTLSHTVISAETSTRLTSNHNPSAFGQGVTFTATVEAVSQAGGDPGGTVRFEIDGQDLGSSVLSGGQATLSVADLVVGGHSVEVTYLGDDTFNPSHDALTQTVTRAGTATTLTSSSQPSVFGQRVTFTATVNVVAPGSGDPNGTVAFQIDGRDAGNAHLGGGQATMSVSDLSVGTHDVRAVYSATGDFTGSADSLAQTVNRADTSMQVVSSANPSVVGFPVTFTTHVMARVPGAGTPTGSIQFQMDGADLGPTVVLIGGSAGITTSGLPAGTHTISATYSGDESFAGSSDWLSQSVQYVTGDCQGAPGRQILPPLNDGDPVSDVNAGSTVPAKFRVCDANGDTVGTSGLVHSFELVKRVSDGGGEEVLHQAWNDGEFKYSNHAWKLNLDTKSLDSGFTYFWSVHLDDGTSIDFRFHLKGGSSTSPGTTKKH